MSDFFLESQLYLWLTRSVAMLNTISSRLPSSTLPHIPQGQTARLNAVIFNHNFGHSGRLALFSSVYVYTCVHMKTRG